MKIGLIDVDGHNFPNLALMRISAYHKSIGDEVEWWWTDFIHYDIVYMSKIFSDEYSKPIDDPINADRVIHGGTGYCISMKDGKEIYDRDKDWRLPIEIEHMFPDYSIYPQFKYAVAMTSRGCPRGCAFCHVASKEGRCSVKVADVNDFWNGQKEIQVLDPNITACKDKRDLFRQYKETNATIEFNQGLDIRLLNDEDIHALKNMKTKNIHFAWDNPKENLEDKFKYFAEKWGGGFNSHGRNGTVYCLTNFNSTEEENLYRVLTLKQYGYKPFVMVYNKPNADFRTKRFQRWVNNNVLFYSVPWEEFAK